MNGTANASASSSTRKIVILGAAWGGLGAAHYLARHVLPQLQKVKDRQYEVHIVSPSSKLWWNISAPRALVSNKEIKDEDYFVPFMDGFAQYGALKDLFIFHHGSATALDPKARTVDIQTHEGATESLTYDSLVIATGARSPTALTTLQGDCTISQQALADMNTKLASAKDVVIAGGGPVGVEVAGEIAYRYGKTAKITLISSAAKLLPILKDSRSDQARKHLEKMGVNVRYNTKVTSSNTDSAGRTEVVLENGEKLIADVYIPAFGVTPNTAFLPDQLKSEKGYVATNPSTMRVDAAGPRVYAAGDVAGVNRGGVLASNETLPVLGANLAYDLLKDAGLSSKIGERKYVRKDVETQVVPIGPKSGVGAFNGWGLPGFAVGLIKGKDYFKGNISGVTQGGQVAKA